MFGFDVDCVVCVCVSCPRKTTCKRCSQFGHDFPVLVRVLSFTPDM